jgi:broad specificity phosphatase PhoE
VRRIALVRHGEAAAGWTDDVDPGLSDTGARQAQRAAESLSALGPLPILTSPLRRCQETARPLATRWNVVPVLEPRVGEIQAPDHDVRTRGPWLAMVMGQRWSELDDEQQAWRAAVVDALVSQPHDCVVFTHFIAINAAIGAAVVDDRVVVHRVGNCSTTMLETDGHSLALVALPAEPDRTEVL